MADETFNAQVAEEAFLSELGHQEKSSPTATVGLGAVLHRLNRFPSPGVDAPINNDPPSGTKRRRYHRFSPSKLRRLATAPPKDGRNGKPNSEYLDREQDAANPDRRVKRIKAWSTGEPLGRQLEDHAPGPPRRRG